MARTPDGLEQITDPQRAEDLYLLAEKRYYASAEGSPDDATLLLTMAVALVAKQLAGQYVKDQSVDDRLKQFLKNISTGN